MHLKDITGASPAPSRQGVVVDVERASGENRASTDDRGRKGPMVVEKRVNTTRIQVRSDWTVSTESNVGRERQERSFLK